MHPNTSQYMYWVLGYKLTQVLSFRMIQYFYIFENIFLNFKQSLKFIKFMRLLNNKTNFYYS